MSPAADYKQPSQTGARAKLTVVSIQADWPAPNRQRRSIHYRNSRGARTDRPAADSDTATTSHRDTTPGTLRRATESIDSHSDSGRQAARKRRPSLRERGRGRSSSVIVATDRPPQSARTQHFPRPIDFRQHSIDCAALANNPSTLARARPPASAVNNWSACTHTYTCSRLCTHTLCHTAIHLFAHTRTRGRQREIERKPGKEKGCVVAMPRVMPFVTADLLYKICRCALNKYDNASVHGNNIVYRLYTGLRSIKCPHA